MEVKLDGFIKLSKLLSDCSKAASPDVTQRAQKAGAEYFVGAMRARMSPRSRARKQHMLDSIDYEQANGETVVGWKLFYGRFVESGHKTVLGYKKGKKPGKNAPANTKSKGLMSVAPRRHMKPEFDARKGEIINRMAEVYQREMGL